MSSLHTNHNPAKRLQPAADQKIACCVASQLEKPQTSDHLAASVCHWPKMDDHLAASGCHWPKTSDHLVASVCHWPQTSNRLEASVYQWLQMYDHLAASVCRWPQTSDHLAASVCLWPQTSDHLPGSVCHWPPICTSSRPQCASFTLVKVFTYVVLVNIGNKVNKFNLNFPDFNFCLFKNDACAP